MEGPHPTVSSVRMADTLVRFISTYKFQFTFNLKLENCKFQLKHINVFLVIYRQMYILYAFQCEIVF